MDGTESHSRVPAHLRPFHRPPSLTPASVKTQPLQEVQSQISLLPELCPLHWRRPPRRSLKSTLKTIICKDWQTLLEQSPPPHALPPRRPSMRMIDSDDYLTARAANPRTGLISPSVGTRTPCTPDSPGDALKLHTNEHDSPTLHLKLRPSVSRANEGRKISDAHTCTKRKDIDGTQWNSPYSATTHQNPGHEVKQYHVSRSSPTLTGDSFVVHMPSAREPQPFAYPGYTAEQIEAVEHYQRKTRRVSSQGYDRRLLHNCGKDSTTLNVAECDNTPTNENGPAVYTCPTGQHFVAYRYHDPRDTTWPVNAVDNEPPQLHVRKRKTHIDKIRQQLDTSPRLDAEAEAKHVFLTSPFTPSPRIITAIDRGRQDDPRYHHSSQQIPRPVPRAEAQADPSASVLSPSKHAQIRSATGEISGRSIFGSAPSCTPVANAGTAAAGDDLYHADGFTKTPSQPPDGRGPCDAVPVLDLCSQLPRVRLVRPEYAAVPRGAQEARHCSFGCGQEDRNGQCTERRNASSSSTILHFGEARGSRQASTSFVDHHLQQARATSNDSRAWILSITLLNTLTDLTEFVQARLPEWIDVVREMFNLCFVVPHDAPAKEKLAAFRALVSLLGQALAVCIAIAVVWKVSVAAVGLVELVMWPLAVPVRILRFVVGLG